MENGGGKVHGQTAQTRKALTDDELTQAAGGFGYSSIRCKKCGKEFLDLDQYRKHIEEGCKKTRK